MGKTKMGGKRPGAGRPRIVGGIRTDRMCFLMGNDLKADIQMAAEEFGITECELVRRALRFALIHKKQFVTIQAKGERHA